MNKYERKNKMTVFKRILSLMLVVALMVGIVPSTRAITGSENGIVLEDGDTRLYYLDCVYLLCDLTA